MDLIRKVSLALAAVVFSFTLTSGELAIKSGEALAFLGDSITQIGWHNAVGYPHLVVTAFAVNGVNITPIPAGISGHKSTNMNARMERDVVNKKPVWMTLSCGVNDVWHGKNGVPLEQYKTEITSICDKADKAGIKVMILTATMIREDQSNPLNQQLVAYNDFLRELAKQRNYLLADLNADMQKLVDENKKNNPAFHGNLLTVDGVHMNDAGNEMMAIGILRAFGMTDEMIAKAKTAWEDIPGACKMTTGFSRNEMKTLKAAADKAKMPVGDYIRKVILEAAAK